MYVQVEATIFKAVEYLYLRVRASGSMWNQIDTRLLRNDALRVCASGSGLTRWRAGERRSLRVCTSEKRIRMTYFVVFCRRTLRVYTSDKK